MIGVCARGNLLRHVLDVCSSKGIKEVSLDVEVTNQNAIRLYKKNGFKFEGISKIKGNNKLKHMVCNL